MVIKCVNISNFGYCILFLCLFVTSIPVYAKSSKEQSLKIAFTSKIIGLIKWNKPSHTKDNKSFKVGVLDDDNVFELMLKYYAEKKIKGKEIEVLKISQDDINDQLDVVYVSDKFSGSIIPLVQICEQNTILLMTSKEGYGEKGSHINFFIDSKKLRFEINLTSLKKAHLHVNSFLLNYARVIGGD
ncbi:MAG: YfiR family protein [Fibrobacterales bacterium]